MRCKRNILILPAPASSLKKRSVCFLADFHVAINQAFPSKAAPQAGFNRYRDWRKCLLLGKLYLRFFCETAPTNQAEKSNVLLPRNNKHKVWRLFYSSHEENNDALGDALVGTYSYQFGSGRPIKFRETQAYNTTPLAEKKYFRGKYFRSHREVANS